MKKFKFKTNINCGNCVAKVKPYMDQQANIRHWEVDTQTADKILTVEGTDISPLDIESLVKEAGFVIKEGPLPDKEGKGLLGKLFG
jgi:copper chaperone